MARGKLIVIDGLDGSGKATQSGLLAEAMARHNPRGARLVSFPDYESPSAALVKMYLAGEFGQRAGDVNAYAASSFYAVDRYASYKEDWGGAYEAGELILANRYTTSNAVHQASKLPSGERDSFLAWLFDLEYGRLGLPKPDLVIYLDLPSEMSEQMLRRRQEETGTQADIHEQDAAYLRHCRENAREIASSLGWRQVHCAPEGVLRTPEDIHEEVWAVVRPLLG